MHQSDEQLLALRPKITTEPTHQPAEAFQNQTLRPILKLLNDRLLLVFKSYVKQRKSTFVRMSPEDQRAYVTHTLKTDQKFRHFLKGLVAGYFTTVEWDKFEPLENELTKRMMNLIEQRLNSQLEELTITN